MDQASSRAEFSARWLTFAINEFKFCNCYRRYGYPGDRDTCSELIRQTHEAGVDRAAVLMAGGTMAQAPRRLTPGRDAQSFFGAELRHWRELRGLSQAALGKALFHSGDTIAKIEKDLRWPQLGLVEGCDEVLTTGGALSRMWPLIETQRLHLALTAQDQQIPEVTSEDEGPDLDVDSGYEDPGVQVGGAPILRFHVDDDGQVWAMIGRRALLLGATATMTRHPQIGAPAQTASPGRHDGALSEFDAVIRATWPGTQLSSSTSTLGQTNWSLDLPGGASFTGATTGIHLESGILRPGHSIQIPDIRTHGPRNRTTPRLMIAAGRTDDSLAYYVAAPSPSQAMRQARNLPTVEIPAAYVLDDLTYAGLWAVNNLDQALLSDDAALAQAHDRTHSGAWAQRHEIARREVPELAAVSQMWLGSDFCARYIVGQLTEVGETPVFWTREQRGEDASTWLLFAHKLSYLRATTALYAGCTDRPVRIFCVPESTVTASSRPERLLLLLSAALMEAHGITVQITADAGYSDVPGFVFGPSSRMSILATWLRDERVWHVDEAARRPIGRDFNVAVGDATADSVTAAPEPLQRLEQLSHYLGLDWRWLRHRSAQLATAGWSGLVQPQSRLLSVTGLDEACRYLAVTA